MGCYSCDKLTILKYSGIELCGINDEPIGGLHLFEWQSVPEWCPKLKEEKDQVKTEEVSDG